MSLNIHEFSKIIGNDSHIVLPSCLNAVIKLITFFAFYFSCINLGHYPSVLGIAGHRAVAGLTSKDI